MMARMVTATIESAAKPPRRIFKAPPCTSGVSSLLTGGIIKLVQLEIGLAGGGDLGNIAFWYEMFPSFISFVKYVSKVAKWPDGLKLKLGVCRTQFSSTGSLNCLS